MTRGEAGIAQDSFYASSSIVPLPMMVRAEGIHFWDREGREYIDVSSGPVVSNIGHGNREVAAAMAEQAQTLDFAYSRLCRHQPNIELAEQITALAGPGYERVALASGGSEAMEIALKFLRQFVIATGRPQKHRIITLSPSYHGGTIATLGISGDPALGPFLENFAVTSAKIPAPLQYRLPEGHSRTSYRMHCADALEAKIAELGAETVLAFVIEPVGGLATGAQPLEADYARRIREICNRHDVYLVYDEILCGSGRTGRFLASHGLPDAAADLVVLAKGLAAGYAPLGAVLMPASMVSLLAERTGFNYSHTYNANPICCATANAVLKIYKRDGLFEAAVERGAQIRKGLEELMKKYAVIGDIRGLGLLMAVELVADPATKTCFPPSFPATEHIRIAGLDNGLMIYSRRTADGANGDWFMISPPLTITADECTELLRRLDAALSDFAARADCFLAGSESCGHG